MASEKVFLDYVVPLGGLAVTGDMVLDTKPGIKQATKDALKLVAKTDTLYPAKAGKLRGKLQWTDAHSWGKIGRLGTYQLKRRQYGIGGDVGPRLDEDMQDGIRSWSI